MLLLEGVPCEMQVSQAAPRTSEVMFQPQCSKHALLFARSATRKAALLFTQKSPESHTKLKALFG